ncbi:unnamed protein product, partial [Vitis vinifera]
MAKNVGILAMDIYFPPSCVQQAFCSEVEDVISMSSTVVTSLLEKYGIDTKQISQLEVGNETVIDKSKSIKTFLMQIFEVFQIIMIHVLIVIHVDFHYHQQ